MRTLITAFLILFSFTALSAWGDSSMWVKIKTGDDKKGEKEYTYVDLSREQIIHDGLTNQVYIGSHYKIVADFKGDESLVFVPRKIFYFDSNEQIEKWIKSVIPNHKCLTIAGRVKC